MYFLNLIIGFIIVCLLNSCTFFWHNKTRVVETNSKSPQFVVTKDSVLSFKSISVINRWSRDNPYRKYDRAELDYKFNENVFYIIVNTINEFIAKLSKRDYLSEIKKITNDSIYSPLLAKKSFINKFNKNQLHTVDFKKLENGIHLVVTIIKESGGIESTTSIENNYDISFVYDFFEVENGDLKSYTSILRARNSSFNKKRWKPLARDARRVFKKLYKISAAQDSSKFRQRLS